MRNEMIGAVVRRAIEHPEFRRKLIESPQDALQSHGFALESAEMEEIEKIRTTIGQPATATMTPSSAWSASPRDTESSRGLSSATSRPRLT